MTLTPIRMPKFEKTIFERETSEITENKIRTKFNRNSLSVFIYSKQVATRTIWTEKKNWTIYYLETYSSKAFSFGAYFYTTTRFKQSYKWQYIPIALNYYSSHRMFRCFDTKTFKRINVNRGIILTLNRKQNSLKDAKRLIKAKCSFFFHSRWFEAFEHNGESLKGWCISSD